MKKFTIIKVIWVVVILLTYVQSFGITESESGNVLSTEGFGSQPLINSNDMLSADADDYFIAKNGSTINCHAEYVAYPDSASPLTYHFLDQSYGDIGYWYWDFGDGSTSTQQNPTHTFTTIGVIYHVCLRIVSPDSTCSDVYCSDVVPGAVGCQAIFVQYPDSLVQNGVRFFNFSIGHLLACHWDFGDNTYSTLKNPVHSFPAPGNYQICLAITDGMSGCNNTKCVDILVQNTASCSSLFTYTGPGLSVTFLGQMTHQQPATYSWDFGDGQTGQDSSIVHTYPNAGTFNVGLTTVDSWGCSYYTTQPVIVPDSISLHYLYGQVFAGDFPMISGMVMLYSKDTVPPFTPYFDMSMVDLNGVYYVVFYPDGDYYLYAMPSLPAGYLPTYYGDVLHWNDAKVISTGHETNPYSIHLLPTAPMKNGDGSINGHITVSTLKTILIYKIMMLLSDSAGNIISYNEVTNNGDFNFNYLAYGTYYLKAEIPGVNSDRIKVVLSADKPDANVSLTFTGNSIIGINDPGNLINCITVYPNPVDDMVNISLKTVEQMTLNFEIINTTGEIVQRMQTKAGRGINHYTLSTGSLNSGIYILRISSDKGFILNRKLVKLN
jgi:PKD repeat protein